MNPSEIPPEGWIDPQRLQDILVTVHTQVAAALWLSAGMLLAFCAIVCTALRWRRTALVFGLGYSATLLFVHNGHALVLGPVGCAVALTALLWPERPAARSLAPEEPHSPQQGPQNRAGPEPHFPSPR